MEHGVTTLVDMRLRVVDHTYFPSKWVGISDRLRVVLLDYRLGGTRREEITLFVDEAAGLGMRMLAMGTN